MVTQSLQRTEIRIVLSDDALHVLFASHGKAHGMTFYLGSMRQNCGREIFRQSSVQQCCVTMTEQPQVSNSTDCSSAWANCASVAILLLSPA